LLSPGFRERVAVRQAETRADPLPGAEETGDQESRMNIIDKTDAEILAMADPLWRELVKASNEGKYGEFAKNFSSNLALAMNTVVANHQFANSELARSLSEHVDSLGIIRRGEHVTVLYRQRSSKKPGEWLGRLVLGYETGTVRIFGASIF
jgi:hypothetical protein